MASVAEGTVSTVNDDTKINSIEKLVVSAPSYEKITSFLDEYEICNTVKFTVATKAATFNANCLPWEIQRSNNNLPTLQWYSRAFNIPYTRQPYLIVGSKVYNCCFGRQLKQQRKKDKRKAPSSRRCGCPALASIQEIVRLSSHTLPEDAPYLKSKPKKALTTAVNTELMRLRSGMTPDASFQWTREFHMTIDPLNAHNHVTGEPAGPHMNIDYRVRDRILTLAKSGILEADVIKENIAHYVENELFKDRVPPPSTNARFYPSYKAIYNHSRAKLKQMNQKSETTTTTATSRTSAELEVTEAAETLYAVSRLYDAQSSSVDDSQSGSRTSSHMTTVTSPYTANNQKSLFTQHRLQRSHQYHHTKEQIDSDDLSEGELSDGSSYQQHTSTRESTPVNISHTKRIVTKIRRTPQDRYFSLLKKLENVGRALEDNSSFIKLSSALVNVMVLAKPLLPKHKVDEIYKVAPAVSTLQSRSRRVYKKRKYIAQPTKPRAPVPNPDFVPPTKKRAVVKVEKKPTEVVIDGCDDNTLPAERLKVSGQSASSVQATPLNKKRIKATKSSFNDKKIKSVKSSVDKAESSTHVELLLPCSSTEQSNTELVQALTDAIEILGKQAQESNSSGVQIISEASDMPLHTTNSQDAQRQSSVVNNSGTTVTETEVKPPASSSVNVCVKPQAIAPKPNPVQHILPKPTILHTPTTRTGNITTAVNTAPVSQCMADSPCKQQLHVPHKPSDNQKLSHPSSRQGKQQQISTQSLKPANKQHASSQSHKLSDKQQPPPKTIEQPPPKTTIQSPKQQASARSPILTTEAEQISAQASLSGSKQQPSIHSTKPTNEQQTSSTSSNLSEKLKPSTPSSTTPRKQQTSASIKSTKQSREKAVVSTIMSSNQEVLCSNTPKIMPKKPKPKVHVVDLVDGWGHPAKAEDKSKIISDAMQFAAFAAEALNLQNQCELTVLISRNEQAEPVFILQPPT